MAEAAKGRKRTKKAFFDDSDDDFSTSTPPFEDQVVKTSKLKKKKKIQPNDKTTVYTSTQADALTPSRAVRKERLSPQEKRFQKELEAALRLSADDTSSSSELVSVSGLTVNSNASSSNELQSEQEHGPSSADTVNVDDLSISSAEQGVSAPPPPSSSSGSNVRFGELTEKEVVVDNDDIAPQSINRSSNAPQTNQSNQAQSTNKSAKSDAEEVTESAIAPLRLTKIAPTKLEAKLGKKKKVKEGWSVNVEKIEVKADVHAAPETKKEEEDSDEEFTLKKKTVAKRRSNERPARKSKSPVIDNEEVNKIEELAEPPRVESPLPRKRKRPAARVIDSDSDSDFGADQKIPRLNAKDENAYEEDEDEDSEEEFVPKSKKKTPPARQPARPVRKSPRKPTTKPLANHCDNIPSESAVKSAKVPEKSDVNTASATMKVLKNTLNSANAVRSATVPDNESSVQSDRLTKVSPAKALGTPQSKLLERSLNKSKIPAWTPPARVGKQLQTGSPASSPAIGLRLGLSRKIRVSKPLHTTVKNVLD